MKPPQPTQTETPAERPELSGEAWLGRNVSEKRRLWERLNPRHRCTLRMLGRAMALRQSQGRLPEAVRAALADALDQIERIAARIERLLAAWVASRTRPRG
ncbi:MAG TPA: hypothetical protein VEH50_13450 [Methylomirabilota bacterium]|nr:hypothetical protein [Methylomirabilota bacterium]